jgi:hypothetical protein
MPEIRDKLTPAALAAPDRHVLSRNPTLYQVNTRVWLTELGEKLGRKATLDDIPDSFFERLIEQGFTWVYFLSVWQTGKIGQQISQSHPGWKEGFLADVPDLKDDEICGSGFAITNYRLHEHFGEHGALKRLHRRVNEHGLKLMLDFVPNHTAIDHIWVQSHPEYFVRADESALTQYPQNYIRVGQEIFAHGRDPYFDGWPDTLQLNYGSPDLCVAIRREIARIADDCDGLRCDMAMLILPDVFQHTWNIEIEPFWTETIHGIRNKYPTFTFMAEVYWDREWDLQQSGFDFTYDKRLYDRLKEGDVRKVRDHLRADIDYQQKSARFLENHDEPRAAGTFPLEQHRAAAVLTYLCPGLRFLHQGQIEGFRKRVSVHISRKPNESVDSDIETFYNELLSFLQLPVVHAGNWTLLDCAPAWENNWTADCLIAFSWTAGAGDRYCTIVNYSGVQAQSYVHAPIQESSVADVVMSGGVGGTPLNISNFSETGFSVDLSPWGFAILKF